MQLVIFSLVAQVTFVGIDVFGVTAWITVLARRSTIPCGECTRFAVVTRTASHSARGGPGGARAAALDRSCLVGVGSHRAREALGALVVDAELAHGTVRDRAAFARDRVETEVT